MSYKLCDTCHNVKLKGLNLFSENDEEWVNFPHYLPPLGKKKGSQEVKIDMGKTYGNCLVYYWGSKQMNVNLNLEYPDSYINNMNSGLVKLDGQGKCVVYVNCPQPYKDRGVSYMSHIHMLVSDKKMSKWKKNIFTQNVLCKICHSNLTAHMKKGDRLIINALDKSYYDKVHIENSFNLPNKKASKMSNLKIKTEIKKMIDANKKISKLMKTSKLKLEEVPIIVYCYDNTCDAGHLLANELFKAGFTNILDYKEGILGYYGRYRID